ncbi:hypothetical protein LOK49_LG01G03839 [Camellia lanceoleosa]|uniref:Uncharacterized protein n=1 Tax=Camellia lanceoleosa TaxID=1840588 RepID=A0ACC0J4C2_9ERIC|nr:hypothetical protein LOK49_LG01G03839 [Camellia lanceoleosa]
MSERRNNNLYKRKSRRANPNREKKKNPSPELGRSFVGGRRSLSVGFQLVCLVNIAHPIFWYGDMLKDFNVSSRLRHLEG